MDYADYCTPAVLTQTGGRLYACHPSLKPVRQPIRLAVAPGGYPAPRSLGLHPLPRTRRGGQVGPALACLHRQPEAAPDHQDTDEPSGGHVPNR
jgi:hypothetical protein